MTSAGTDGPVDCTEVVPGLIVRSGKIDKVFGQMMDELKPEAAYFFPENSQRAGLMVVNLATEADIAPTLERFWFGLAGTVS